MAGEGRSSEGQIGAVACLAFAVGTIVGGGVFTLSGIAIDKAGPAALISYLLAGLVMMLSALCFVAVATRAAPGDSGYGPVGDILGPLWRFLVMWGFYLTGLTILTFLTVSFGNYLHDYFLSSLGVTTIALLVTAGLTLLNLGPSELVAQTETVVVAIKIAILLAFAAWGVVHVDDAHWRPFAPHGAHGVLAMTALLFTAYTGFNVVTNMAGSVRDPRRTVPVAIIGSVVISAIVYIGVVIAMLASGVTDFGAAGVGQAADALIGSWGGYVIALCALLSTLSGANANVLASSELMLRLVAQEEARRCSAGPLGAANPTSASL